MTLYTWFYRRRPLTSYARQTKQGWTVSETPSSHDRLTIVSTLTPSGSHQIIKGDLTDVESYLEPIMSAVKVQYFVDRSGVEVTASF